MRRKGLWLSVLAAAMFAGSASAITADGNYGDWFTSTSLNINTHKVWNPLWVDPVNASIRHQADENGPTPGAGGQDYDIEHIFWAWEDFDSSDLDSGGLLHIAMVTGFAPDGRNGSGGPHFAGDMFVDLGANGFWDIAVGVGTELGGTHNNRAWANTGSWDTDPVNILWTPDSSPYRVDENGPDVLEYGVDAPIAGLYHNVAWGLISNTVTLGSGGTGNERWFLEITVELDGNTASLLQEELVNNGAGTGGLGLHWTMLCGNDVVDVLDGTPLAPIPEPATMVLLGMGVLGIALRARRPQC